MKVLKTIGLSSLLLATSLFAKDFAIDVSHSNVGFSVKHMAISNTKGNFKDFTAVLDFDPDSNTFKKVEANIKVASINTEDQKRDNHLKAPDFFDADKNPEIKFVMSKYEKEDDDEGKMTGDLTIKGVTKQVVLDTEIHGVVKDQKGKQRVGFTLEGKIDRKDFKVGETFMAQMIGDKVKLEIDVEGIEK